MTPARETRAPEPAGAEARILVVEDDGVVARDLEQSLGDLGYAVAGVASSATEALRRASEARPDLVLMDIRLPGETDGVDAATVIDRELGVPVVYLTAHADRQTLRRVTRSAPYGYVVKPYDARSLESAIELALHRKRREMVRDAHERWFERILERVKDVVAVVDPGGGLEYVNPAVRDVLGYDPDDLVGRSLLELLHPDDRDRFDEECLAGLREPGRALEDEVRVRTTGGAWRALSLSGQVYSPRPEEEGPRLVLNARDVTERREEQRRLAASEERYRLLFEESVSGAFQATLDGRFLDANRALLRILGYGRADELVGQSMARTFAEEDLAFVLGRLDAEGAVVNREVEVSRPGRGAAHMLLSAGVTRVPERAEPMIVGTMVDISERKRLEADLEWMAYHDTLTGLVNRRGLGEQAIRYLSLAERQGSRLALLYLDLEGFKEINDRHGHDAGDRVLAEVADRLRREARESDIVARVGGDEFIALLPDVESPEAAASAARRYARGLEEPVVHEGGSISVSGQVGVAVFPDHGTTLDELTSAADRAMYRLKGGEDVVALAETNGAPEPGEDPEARALREALDDASLLVHYQPVVRSRDGVAVGAEALLRRRRAGERPVAAAEFLPLAERAGLLSRLDAFMLERVRLDVAEAALPPELEWISVNLAVPSLGEGEVSERLARLAAELRERGLGVFVEISERSRAGTVPSAARDLRRLRSEGVSIALDDFGSGPSSLAVLASLSAELVKLERQGQFALERAEDHDAAVRGLVQLVHGMGSRVVLKRVEQPDLSRLPAGEVADYLQGFATGRPGALSALSERGASGASAVASSEAVAGEP